MKLLDTDETNTKRLLDIAIEKILGASMGTIFEYIQAGQVLVRREHIIPGALEEARRVVAKLFDCILHFTDESKLCEITIFLANMIFLAELPPLTDQIKEGVQKLISFIAMSNDQLSVNSAWALGNMASSTRMDYLTMIVEINPFTDVHSKIQEAKIPADGEAVDIYLWLYGALITRTKDVKYDYVCKYVELCNNLVMPAYLDSA